MNSLWDHDWSLYPCGYLSVQFRALKTFSFLHASHTCLCVCLLTCVYLTSYRQWESTASNSLSSPLWSHQTADMHNELYSLFIFRISMNSGRIIPTRSPSTFMSSNAISKIWRLFFFARGQVMCTINKTASNKCIGSINMPTLSRTYQHCPVYF